MCNFCDFLDTTDIEQLANSNPWSTEEQYAVPCEAASENKALEFPMAESFLLGMIPERTSSRGKVHKRQKPSHYPSFRIRTTRMEADEVGIYGAYELNRHSTIIESDNEDSSTISKKKPFALSRNSLSLALRPSTRRSDVSFVTSQTESTPRSSTSTRTGSPPSPSDSLQSGYFTPKHRVVSSNTSLSDRSSQRYSTQTLISMIDRELKMLR